MEPLNKQKSLNEKELRSFSSSVLFLFGNSSITLFSGITNK
jgi:hypothetical protein